MSDYVIESSRKFHLSPGAWAGVIAFACLFLATQDINAPLMWRDDGSADIAGWVDRVAEGRASRQVGFLTLAGFGVLGLLLPARRDEPRRRVWPLLFPLVSLVLWAYLSVLWSDDRSLTAKRLVVFTAIWTSVEAAVKHLRMRDVAVAAGTYAGLTLLAGLYAEFLHRGVGEASAHAWRFAGTGSPNNTGLVAFFLAAAMLHGIVRRGFTGTGTGWRWLIFASALGILWMTRSRTSLAIALLALSTQASLAVRPTRAAAAALAGATVLSLGVFLVIAGLLGPVWQAALMGRDSSNVQTLTGRTDIWAFAIEEATQDPARAVAGHGHDTFWSAERTQQVSRRVGFTISESHNAYLEAWLNLGLVGTLAWAVAVAGSAAVWAGRARPTGLDDPVELAADASFGAAVCLAAVVHGLAESTFTHAQFGTLVLFTVCGLAALPREKI
jgi:O-antigen ligase